MLVLVTAVSCCGAQTATPQARIGEYIDHGWDTLSRSMNECKSVVDPKVTTAPVIYLPAGYGVPAAVAAMEQSCRVEVRHLPRVIHHLGDVRPQELPVEGRIVFTGRGRFPKGLPRHTLMLDSLPSEFPASDREAMSVLLERWMPAWNSIKKASAPSQLALPKAAI